MRLYANYQPEPVSDLCFGRNLSVGAAHAPQVFVWLASDEEFNIGLLLGVLIYAKGCLSICEAIPFFPGLPNYY
jgi:hypothetical protein